MRQLEQAHAPFRPICLEPARNNVGITSAADTGSGALNVWGNSLPAEDLPSDGAATVDGVPFTFPVPDPGTPDNVRCEGQIIELPADRYDWLYLLVTAERRVEDEVAFHFVDGSVDFEPLRVSDFWAGVAAFGERPAFRTASMHYPHHVQAGVPGVVWCQRVPVVRGTRVRAARLPDNPAVHVFAATLVRRHR
jgi:hypothetical protein